MLNININHDDNCDNSDNNQDEPNGEEASVLLSDEGGKQPAVSILCRFPSIIMMLMMMVMVTMMIMVMMMRSRRRELLKTVQWRKV